MAFSEVDSTDRYVEFNADGPTKNLTKSTGTASGDFAIIVVSWYEVNNYTVTTPTGFTAQGELVIGGSGTTESRLAVFTRACDGTEAANYPITFSNAGVFANAVLITLRSSNGAITFGSATQGTPASGTTCTAPSVSGTSGQALVCPFGYGDPTTVSTPGGMTVGPTGGTSTNGATWFWETLVATGATGTRASTLGTSRDNGAWSILLTEPSGISPIPLGKASKPKKSGTRRNWDKSGWFNTRGHAKGWFWRGWVPATGAGGITEADGAATGAGAAAAISGATAGSPGASTGVGTATGIGAVVALGTGASTGVGTATGISAALAAGVAAAAGTGAATGVGVSLAAGVASSAGIAAATSLASATAVGVGSSAGLGTATGLASATALGTAASTGLGTATGLGTSIIAGVGSSAGLGTATGLGLAVFAGVGNVAGAATAQADGEAIGGGSVIVEADGAASGSSSATGISSATAGSIGATAGIATITGLGAAVFGGVGNSSGTGAGSGIAVIVLPGNGAASGSATATGLASAVAISIGSSAGTAAPDGIGGATCGSVGNAAGISVCLGVSDLEIPVFANISPHHYTARVPSRRVGYNPDAIAKARLGHATDPVNAGRLGPVTDYVSAARLGSPAPVITVHAPPDPPVLLSVVSRKTHGAAGDFDITIDTSITVSGNVTIEPRTNAGGHTIVFTFDKAIAIAGSVTSVDSTGAALGSASAAAVGNTVVVTLNGAANKKRCQIDLAGVNGNASARACLGLLIGDVNGSRFTNTGDRLLVAARDGEVVNADNAKYDIDLSGIIEGLAGGADRALVDNNGGPLGT